ncbi:long-chain-fatty-acid--CoA ligase [uncultured Ilumatobacter sp.]|uniref:long-chain-fatty-acid--CoA ligase n=1 Tax=uncultured Ilumatobacter sp. TaxID=879968 RepID=UPI00374E7D48
MTTTRTTQPYLTQTVHTAARTRPDDDCLICGDRTSTNVEFRDRIARLAGAFQRLGIGPDDRIAMLSLNSDRLIEAFYACFWSGSVANPINSRWNPNEMAYAINDCGATALLVDDTFAPLAATMLAEVPSLTVVIFSGDGDTPTDMLSFESLVAEGPAVPDAGRSGDDLAMVLYTGGTTGASKGVMLSHTNLVTASLGMLAAGCGTGDVYLHAPPLFHIAGVQLLVGHFLSARGPQIIPPAFDPVGILRDIQQHRVTDVLLVPTMMQMVLTHPERANYDLGSLQRIYYGAAPMTDALLRTAMAAVPDAGFIQGYGMTETALTVMLPAYYYTGEGLRLEKTGSIGKVTSTAELAIRDAEGNEVPPGTVGEISVRSASVMVGYWGRPDLTAETIRDGWLYSGDGGYVDDDGFVYLVDRIKDMIVSGAENVYSSEVEAALVTHPAVAMAAVIGVPDEKWGERVHAVIALRPDTSTTEAELIAHAKERIAAYKCPRTVEFVDALPISAAGKVLKNELRTRHQEQTP